MLLLQRPPGRAGDGLEHGRCEFWQGAVQAHRKTIGDGFCSELSCIRTHWNDSGQYMKRAASAGELHRPRSSGNSSNPARSQQFPQTTLANRAVHLKKFAPTAVSLCKSEGIQVDPLGSVLTVANRSSHFATGNSIGMPRIQHRCIQQTHANGKTQRRHNTLTSHLHSHFHHHYHIFSRSGAESQHRLHPEESLASASAVERHSTVSGDAQPPIKQ